MISELQRALLTEQSMYGDRIADTRAVLKSRNAELATYRRYAKRIGEMLEGEIYLACRVSLYEWSNDKYVSAYVPNGLVIVQTVEPAGFDEALSELGLGLKERNFRGDDTVVDTLEVVSARNVTEGIVLPSRWSRNWFQSEVLGLQLAGLCAPGAETLDTPKINTPPRFFTMPPVERVVDIVEPVRKAKVLIR
jgi:hypothetical protein